MVIKDSRCYIKVFLRNAVVPNQIGPEERTEYAVLGIGFPRRRDILFLDPAEYGHGAW